MEERLARCIENVHFIYGRDFDNEFDMRYITYFNNSYDEFEFETYTTVDILKRGWFGDIVYTVKYDDNTTSNVYLRDVILLRVLVEDSVGEVPTFRYIFNKF